MIWLLACDAPEPTGADAPPDAADCSSPQTWYPDSDGDTYGDPGGATFQGCDPPGGFVLDHSDCDDGNATVHPAAEEPCDGVDQDCDGAVEGEAMVWYDDRDGDGYGDPATGAETCTPEAGAVTDGTDCDDADPAVHPSAEEVCDDDDDDCDGVADLGEVGVWHSDADGDGYGSAYDRVEGCASPGAGYTQVGGDCQPSDASTFPGAPEACNDSDDDCDGDIDEDFEADGDGYRSDACNDGTDCDDLDATTNPGVVDDPCGDGLDQDCSGADRVCGFDPVIDLAAVDVLYGDASDGAAMQLRVGDVNADGVDDLFASTLYADGTSGGGWVYTGAAPASGNFSDVAWEIQSDPDSLGAGRSIGLGDLDGDGIGDIAFGAPYATDDGLRVVLGPIDGPAQVSDGIWLVGPPSVYAGHGADVGDVNGDGIEDAVVGAYLDVSSAGGVYVSYGPVTVDVDLPTQADAHLVGDGGLTGRWLRADGDFNGDGVSDLLIATPTSTRGAPAGGGLFMVYGPPDAAGDLEDVADGRYIGTRPSEYAGMGLGEGDVDGDGLDDVLMGTYYSTNHEGAAYVFYGPATGDIDAPDADIFVLGDAAEEYFGFDMVTDDLDGDGGRELVVGGPGAAGGAWVFTGLTAGSYTSADAFCFMPTLHPYDTTGAAVQVGDLDGDGLREVVVGAPIETTNGANAGAAYVVEYAR